MLFPNNILQKGQVLDYRYRHLCTGNYPGFYHYHRGIEILLIHRGKGQLVLNGRMYPLESGNIVFIQPFQLHRLHFEVHEHSPYERTILTFEPTSFEPFFSMFPKVLRFFEHMWKDDLSDQVFHMGSDEAYISAVLERCHQKMSDRDSNDQLEPAAMMILQLLDYLESLQDHSPSHGTPRTERHAEKIMEWIEKYYTSPFDLDALAKELHLSRHHISHLFRTETGSTITDYLIARRIRQACWLLKIETTSIEHIGVRVGIPNFAYFCRLFKKITGLTPKQYRNNSV